MDRNFSVVLRISFFSVSQECFCFYFFIPFLIWFKLRHTFILLKDSYQLFGAEFYIKYYVFICVAFSASFILSPFFPLLFLNRLLVFIVSVFYHIFEWWHLVQNSHGKNSHWLQQALAWDILFERQVAMTVIISLGFLGTLNGNNVAVYTKIIISVVLPLKIYSKMFF